MKTGITLSTERMVIPNEDVEENEGPVVLLFCLPIDDNSIKLKDLKGELEIQGLSRTGTKQVLIDRLKVCLTFKTTLMSLIKKTKIGHNNIQLYPFRSMR